MTLSTTHNGKVYKTSGSGYSPRVIANKLVTFCKESGIKVEFEIANTGSAYVRFTTNDTDYSIRISNHTKRTYGEGEINEVCAVEENEYWVNPMDKSLGMEKCKEVTFEVLNTNCKKSLFAHLGIK